MILRKICAAAGVGLIQIYDHRQAYHTSRFVRDSPGFSILVPQSLPVDHELNKCAGFHLVIVLARS